MTNFEHGRQAEAVAAAFLKTKGCTILEQNWRTRRCEIDIVAQKGEIVYLCEVKYRINRLQGSGFDYITAKKLAQMRFAAELWVQAHNWPHEYRLCVIEVSGPQYKITNVVNDL